MVKINNEEDGWKIVVFLVCVGEEMLDIYNDISEVETWSA